MGLGHVAVGEAGFLDQRPPYLLHQGRALDRHGVDRRASSASRCRTASPACAVGWNSLFWVSMTSVTSTKLVVPCGARHQEPIAGHRVNEIGHIPHLHRRDQLGDQVGPVHDGQVDLGAVGLFPGGELVDDRLVLGLVEALGPPDGDGLGGLGRPGARGGGGGDGSQTGNGMTAGQLVPWSSSPMKSAFAADQPLTPPMVRPLLIFLRNE